MELIQEIIIFGTIKGCVYALIATGFTLIFAVAGILNLAHGTFYMLGAYFTYTLFYALGIPLPPAILLAAVLVGGLGMLLDRVFLKPMRSSHTYVLVLTVAVAFAAQEIILLTYGSQGMNIPNLVPGSVSLNGVVVSWHQLLIVAITAAVLLMLWLVLTHTRYGVATLAVSMDEDGARLVGIETEKVFNLSMFASAFLAAVAGALISPIMSMTPEMWNMPLMKAFVVVVVGGIGSLTGSILAAFFLGWLETFTGFVISPKLTEVVSLVLLTVFLVFRPSGILGRRLH
ncbi:MAG: branched-chain amino acid ABC transporter permease [Desulfarculaceae bacterium]|nr:branched-chain amino acid ABC transporter permease [Desulfarculaceae bacterium]MCF8048714.1 branched-chain amino acid ABC transporter permease [Desulfarculaceae bacterium]MCF8065260.1 branched-chain amino acid ABC transporter permease [Desulfarculaceae bacterium]MCF8098933.1 branched-chain amino acid ABC transporter permease [Desulfarculaceae bacterium]MCF8121653.1 branched-chain amino acid ABC transporter permease [Desulfarculaceae bacterium]